MATFCLAWLFSFCIFSLLWLHVFFFFKLINLFIYFWLCWVFVSVRGLSLVAASGGHSSSRCAGLSLSRPLLLRSTGSRRASSVVVAHGPSCSVACGIFLDQGSNPCPLHWQADSQPLHHQGSPTFILWLKFFYRQKAGRGHCGGVLGRPHGVLLSYTQIRCSVLMLWNSTIIKRPREICMYWYGKISVLFYWVETRLWNSIYIGCSLFVFKGLIIWEGSRIFHKPWTMGTLGSRSLKVRRVEWGSFSFYVNDITWNLCRRGSTVL